MKHTFRAVVIDDHPLMAQATRELLEQIDNVELVEVANDGQTGLELVQRHRPDLVLLDYQLPDREGSDLAAAIKAMYPKTHVVIFTGVDVSALTNRFLELEVSGVISKGTRRSAIRSMIDCILDNHIVLPRSYLKHLKMNRYQETDVELSEDETLLMFMVVKGATLEQVAQKLHISKRSVDNYQRKIFDKFGVKTRAQAIEKFIQSQYYIDGQGGR